MLASDNCAHFLLWVELEEIMPAEWKNPIRKVQAPRVPLEPIEPVVVDEVHALLEA